MISSPKLELPSTQLCWVRQTGLNPTSNTAKTWLLEVVADGIFIPPTSDLSVDFWPNIWDAARSSGGFDSRVIQAPCRNLSNLLRCDVAGIEKLPGSVKRR